MAAKTAVTWLNYMSQLSKKKIPHKQLLVEGIDNLIQSHKNAFNILNHSVPMVYLLDYTTGKYVMASKQCRIVMDCTPETLLDGGISFVLERYHPGDLQLFNKQIFVDRLNVLKTIPVEQHKDHVFTYNLRVKNGSGKYVNLLQRNSFIQSDENGNPLLSLGMLINIDHFKEEDPVIQLVEKIDSVTGNADVILKQTYYLREEDKTFSKRERNVLNHMAEGLTSKQIADKLFISEHTVINHKRNMQHKSNTQNAAALISFAFRNHLL